MTAAEAWLDRFAREQPEPGVAIAALGMLLFHAEERGDEARIADLYALVESPRFAGTFDRGPLARQYAPDRVLRRGNTLPHFDFAALQDPGKRITKQDRMGKVYLVELWATWCGPCVAEMPKLHETYKAINGARLGKGKGEKALRKLRPVPEPRVEFLFVSLDGTEEDVAAFRREHWSMPWTHAFVGGRLDGQVMRTFGAVGVPTAILVDEHGKILEYGRALRNEQLRATLERVLAAEAAQ